MHHDADSTTRIMAVADELFAQGGHAQFPTVDAVRKAARVSMNDATNVMKAWRRAQLASPRPDPVQVPPALHDIHRTGLEALWVAAQEQASQGMADMQTAWDAERAENEQLHRELVEAFEAQASELELSKVESAACRERVARLEAEADRRMKSLAGMQLKLSAAQSDVRTHAARAAEIERRAGDLRQELDRARAAQAAKEAAGETELAAVRAEMRHLMQMVAGAIGGSAAPDKNYSEQKRQ